MKVLFAIRDDNNIVDTNIIKGSIELTKYFINPKNLNHYGKV